MLVFEPQFDHLHVLLLRDVLVEPLLILHLMRQLEVILVDISAVGKPNLGVNDLAHLLRQLVRPCLLSLHLRGHELELLLQIDHILLIRRFLELLILFHIFLLGLCLYRLTLGPIQLLLQPLDLLLQKLDLLIRVYLVLLKLLDPIPHCLSEHNV